MESTDIIRLLNEAKTVKAFSHLLEAIKKDEFPSIRWHISEKMMRHFSSDTIAPRRYRTFHIRKKSGGVREIKAPCNQLDVILTCINILLKAIYVPSDSAMGFTSGRSVVTNASIHLGHNYVFNIDLKDFFPSISQARVWKRIQLPPFNFPCPVANLVAGLCCTRDTSTGVNVLPQGSPASPLLTNAICDTLDRRMKGVAKRFGLHYTRYADDMTFSSMHNVYHEGSAFREEVARIISGQGFRLNPTKTRLQKTGERQEVTGLTVNAVANVSRKYISDLRWILHVWEKFGYAEAYARFYPKYKMEKGYVKKGEPVMENVIGGKLNYLKMVKGSNNPIYLKLEARYEALQELVFVDEETDDSKSFVYVQPYSLADFERLFGTEVHLELSREKKVVGKCKIGGRDKVLVVSKATQRLLCPEAESLSAGDRISSDELAGCFVTLCRSKGKNFWLITKSELKRSRCLSIQNLKVDPDELLSLWEAEGFEETARRLEAFVQFGKPGESLLNWKVAEDGTAPEIDRGRVFSGKQYLLKYFLKHPHLSHTQRQKLIRLLMPMSASLASKAVIEELLGIWEKDGLDAAVKAWKKLKRSSIAKSRKKRAGSKGKKGSFSPVVIEEPDTLNISEEDYMALQAEIEAGGGEPSDLQFDWEDDDDERFFSKSNSTSIFDLFERKEEI